jgi:uncharacterized NAD(P)/FAD-binding protein YdhS
MMRYCIIGTGFSGTCMLWHLIDALCRGIDSGTVAKGGVVVTTVERQPTNGPGFPYGSDCSASYYLCNNPAEKMSLFDNDFVAWMWECREQIIAGYPELILASDPSVRLDQWEPVATAFYPRALFGIYLSRRFEEACARAASYGITVCTFNGHEAIDGATHDDHFTLTIQCRTSGKISQLEYLDKVLLASGHWCSEQSCATVLASPYPPEKIHASISAYQTSHQRRQLTVYVHGMGPSAVDAILSVCEHGRFVYGLDGLAQRFEPDWRYFGAENVKVVAGSRSGFFPGVRWPLLSDEFRYLKDNVITEIRQSNHGAVPLDNVIALIDAELAAASDGRLSFNNVATPPFANAYDKLITDIRGERSERTMHAVILRARRLRFYEHLLAADKRRYDKQLDTHFIRTAVPIPLQNAKKLVALIDAGVLSTVRLGYKEQLGGLFPVDGEQSAVQPDIVIRSQGHDYDMRRHPSQLIRYLLEAGELIEYSEDGYRTGGIAVSESSGFQVAHATAANTFYSNQLYAFGPVAQYWQNQNNFAAAFVNAAKVVAQDWTVFAKASSNVFRQVR